MKLGNTSQSIVSVPNFYFNRTLKERETFTVSNKKRYFRETDLFRFTKDLNYSNNQRKNNRAYDELNREKYIPVHRIGETINFIHQTDTTSTETESTAAKENHLRTIGEFKNFTDKMDKTNYIKNTQGDLREDIRNNINTLLDRVNSKFDMSKWNQYDTKTNFSNHNEILFTPITTYNEYHDSESTKFKRTLLNKVSSLSVVDETSKAQAKLYLKRINEENKNKNSNLPNVLLSNRSNSINNNNSFFKKISPFQLLSRNFTLTDRSYTSIPNISPTRIEFNIKRGEKISFKRKHVEDYLVNKTKYNASKHNEIYCEGYNTLGSMLKTFKNYSNLKTTFT